MNIKIYTKILQNSKITDSIIQPKLQSTQQPNEFSTRKHFNKIISSKSFNIYPFPAPINLPQFSTIPTFAPNIRLSPPAAQIIMPPPKPTARLLDPACQPLNLPTSAAARHAAAEPRARPKEARPSGPRGGPQAQSPRAIDVNDDLA